MKIGVFDSGLGGLTILNAIRESLPLYDYIYYADTKNLPYGDKAEKEIVEFTRAAIEELFSHGVVLVVIACNTASAETVRVLQDTMLVGEYEDRRLLGVIIPTIETLLESDAKNVLLIGTTRTVTSKKYDRELEKRNAKHITLSALPTPALVPLIESGDTDGSYAYLDEVLTSRMGEVDTLILGCTHYTVLKNYLRAKYGFARILSQDEIIPMKLKSYLDQHPEIENKLSRGGTVEKIQTGE